MWQPIETAPKDGTPVLVGWCGRPWEPAKVHCEDGVFGLLSPDMGFHPATEQPTHWMPLPDPPTTE